MIERFGMPSKVRKRIEKNASGDIIQTIEATWSTPSLAITFVGLRPYSLKGDEYDALMQRITDRS